MAPKQQEAFDLAEEEVRYSDDDTEKELLDGKVVAPTNESSNASSLSSSSQEQVVLWSSSTVALCLCMLTHSYLLISVFPYSGYMAVNLVEGVTADTAGSYAGCIAATFMAGRATTSYGWGVAADRYGRTTVLYLSLGLSAILSLLFGLAPSFTAVLVIRFLLGASNGIMGTIKTVVSELASNNEKQESTIMSTVVGFWGWGFLLSPAISGSLAEPVRQYPNVSWLQLQPDDDGWMHMHRLLTQFPFLLPNLLGSVLCLIGAATVALFVRETLPDHQRRSVREILPDLIKAIQRISSSCCCCFFRRRRKNKQPQASHKRRRPYDTVKTHDDDHDDHDHDERITTTATTGSSSDDDDDSANPAEVTTTMASLWSRSSTRSCLQIYWAFSFVSLTADEVFPLFCMSPVAGLGLKNERDIGTILSLCGLLFALSQYAIQNIIYNRFGLLGSVRLGAIVTAPTMFAIPLVLLWNHHHHDGDGDDKGDSSNNTVADVGEVGDTTITAATTSSGSGGGGGDLQLSVLLYLALVLAVYRLFSLAFFANISVAINRTVPNTGRATVNGLTAGGGSIAKCLGPVCAGLLVSQSVQWFDKAAAYFIFGCMGLLACIVAVLSFRVMREDEILPEQSSNSQFDDDDNNNNDDYDNEVGETKPRLVADDDDDELQNDSTTSTELETEWCDDEERDSSSISEDGDCRSNNN